MRKVICYVATSIDGYLANDDGSVDWLDAYTSLDYGYAQFTEQIDTAVMGWETYKQSLEFGEAAFSDQFIYYVFSSRTHPAADRQNVRFTRESPVAFYMRMQKEQGKNIWMMGGGRMIASFLAKGLIDEMMLFTIPEMLGSGIPLFAGSAGQWGWNLRAHKTYDNGVVLSHYELREKER